MLIKLKQILNLLTATTTNTIINIILYTLHFTKKDDYMKFTCERQKLVDSVLNVQRAVSSKSTIPALEGILINVQDNELEMVGYNLELGITTCIPVKVFTPGKIILNAKIFSDIIRKLPDDEVTIKTDEKNIANITSGNSKFSIIGIPAEEFPELPTISDSSDITISREVLKGMIRQTLFAISDNDSKPIHTGTLFDISKDKIKLISVDGYRLAMRTEPIKSEEELSFVVPGKTLGEILKLIPDSDSEVNISIGKRHIIFELNNYRVISRLLEGEFLDYNAAIPFSTETKVIVNTRKFMDSVDRISLLITDRIKSPIRCIFSDNQIKLSCATTIGKANDEIDAPIEGSDVEIGFNNRYLLEALKNAECDEVLIELNGALSPMKVLPKDGEEFLFLVLPVRLKSE